MTAKNRCRFRILAAVVWMTFIVKSSLYTAVTPLWEGFDELFHFAHIHMLASTRSLPVWGNAFVDAGIAQSTAYVPLADLMPPLAPQQEKLSYSDYWRLSPQERDRLAAQLRGLKASTSEYMPSKILNYQIQHPPLYYFLCAPLYRVLNDFSIADKVFAIRLFSALIASLCIIAAVLIGKEIDSRIPLAIAALVVAWPCLYMDIARVGNDCLSIALFSFLFLFMIRYGSARSMRSAAALGIVLGLGLITKATFLTAVPAIVLYFALMGFHDRDGRREIIRDGSLALLCTAALGGCWYFRNYLLYGSFSGLQESVLFPSVGFRERIAAALGVPWGLVFKNFFVTFCWVNGWSLLRLPKSFYLVFMTIFCLSVVGLVRLVNSRRIVGKDDEARFHALSASVCLLTFFGLGLLYHQINASATAKSMGGPGGWYLYALIVPISLLVWLGIENMLPKVEQWTFLIVTASLAMVELFGILFVLVPYYTGLAHPASGGWGTDLSGGLAVIFSRETVVRLLTNKPHSLSMGVLSIIGFVYCGLQAIVLSGIAYGAGKNDG